MAINAQSFQSLYTAGGSSSYNTVAQTALATLFGGSSSNVTNAAFKGSGTAAFVVDTFSINGAFSKSGGILLSSGGLPGSTNTSNSYTVSNGTDGDADLTAVAQTAFTGAGATRDAVTLEFDYVNNDPNINTLQFSFVFGSDEYPEYSDTSFIDIAAVFVNTSNQALFNNATDQPLSVTDKNLALGNFLDNTGGAYDIEWDGFSKLLTIRAALTQGVNHIKVGIADTGDTAYDSGLYITGVKLSNDGATGGGTLVVVDAPEGGGDVSASIAPEEFNLGTGDYSVKGAAANLNGDVITGFGQNDKLVLENVVFSKENVKITYGSLIIDMDTNGDGVADTKVTLAGSYQGKDVAVTTTAGNTQITVGDPTTGTTGNDVLKGTPGTDVLKGLAGNDKIYGEAGNDSLYGDAGNDLVKGGSGNDKLYGGAGADKLYGEAGNDTLLGGAGNDTLDGGIGNDKVYGDAGNDSVTGGVGNDKLYGGAGSDKLYGGAGNDTLFGGAGADKFYFLNDTKGRDVVSDFSAGKAKGDVLVLDKDLYASFADVLSDAKESALGVTLDYGTGKIIILDAEIAKMAANDFLFV